MFCVASGLKRMNAALREFEEKNISPDSLSVKAASEESQQPKREDGADSDNAAVVNSTSSPQSKSSEQPKEKDSSVPDTDPLDTEDVVLLDREASKPADSLGSLIGTLRNQIHSSDWLEKNTPELSAGENPEILDVFKALLQRAGK